MNNTILRGTIWITLLILIVAVTLLTLFAEPAIGQAALCGIKTISATPMHIHLRTRHLFRRNSHRLGRRQINRLVNLTLASEEFFV